MPPSQQTFDENEKVLCFHLEMLYEAKVLDVRQIDKDDRRSPYRYKVHYKGWKASWDDWVPQDRLRKFTDENLELARNLKREIDRVNAMARPRNAPASAAKGKRNAGSTRPSEERSTPHQLVGKKRVRDADTERVDEWRDKPQIRLPFPDILKGILVDDWEMITWQNLMVKLPSATPLSQLLDDYYAFQSPSVNPDTVQACILEELTQGMREYFNLALGRILLYKQERRQFMEWRKRINDKNDPIHKDGEKQLFHIYGPEHFLRLLTMMPELTAQTNLDAQSVNRLRDELINMLMWVAQKDSITKYFGVPYVDNHYLEEHERNGPHKHEQSGNPDA